MPRLVQFDITSDLHFDFYRNKTQTLKDRWESYEPKSRYLIVAGDLGHQNSESVDRLNELAELFYDKIIVITGNHDLYNFRHMNVDLDKFNSHNVRVNNLKSLLHTNEKVFLLDGDVINIDGVTVGGCMAWYEGIYNGCSQEQSRRDWNSVMRDGNQIDLKDFTVILKRELKKLRKIIHADIVITHVNPSNEFRHQAQRFKTDMNTRYFCFNGQDYIKKSYAKYWIFGHTHDPIEYKYHGTRCIANPLGYPHDNPNYKLRQITVSV